MHLYIHRLSVTVVTAECSPDRIKREIERQLGSVDCSVSAITDKENRMRSPSITVPDPPVWPTSGRKADELAYFVALDTWRDAYFPRADSVEVNAKA